MPNDVYLGIPHEVCEKIATELGENNTPPIKSNIEVRTPIGYCTEQPNKEDQTAAPTATSSMTISDTKMSS